MFFKFKKKKKKEIRIFVMLFVVVEFKRETRNDLVALRRMMVSVLLFPLKRNGNEQDVNEQDVDEQLKTQKVSLPFKRFIENLSTTELV